MAKTTRARIRRVSIIVMTVAIATMLYVQLAGRDRVIGRSAGSVTLLSKAHTIDKLYPSMLGPNSEQDGIPLVDNGSNELLWLTGVSSELVDADSWQAISREFFCHSNLTIDPASRDTKRTKDITPCGEGRLFTLVPGRLSLQLPKGFGVPVLASEPVSYFTMSLNLNEQPSAVKLRFKTNVQFVRDGEVKQPMKALFRRALYGYEPIGKASPHAAMCMGGMDRGATCGPFVAEKASNAFNKSLGKTNTVHWMIPPGKYESRVDVTEQLDLPFDTTAHYVTGHLHPFGESIQLVDKTTNEVVLEVKAKDWSDKRGVEAMEEISSQEGIKLYRDHVYELVTRYENPTGQPIDAMSILYVYARDVKFENARGTQTLASR
jgi:hypothetical protein